MCVAFLVVYEKFRQSAELRSVLFRTGDRMIAEATSRDNFWGIGIDVDDDRVHDPSMWEGTQVLTGAIAKHTHTCYTIRMGHTIKQEFNNTYNEI